MPRGEHLSRVRLSKEERLALLHREPLLLGEVSQTFWVRLPRDLAERFRAMSAKARGRVVKIGFETFGEVQDATTNE